MNNFDPKTDSNPQQSSQNRPNQSGSKPLIFDSKFLNDLQFIDKFHDDMKQHSSLDPREEEEDTPKQPYPQQTFTPQDFGQLSSYQSQLNQNFNYITSQLQGSVAQSSDKSPTENKSWSTEQDANLVKFYKELDGDWKKISKQFSKIKSATPAFLKKRYQLIQSQLPQTTQLKKHRSTEDKRSEYSESPYEQQHVQRQNPEKNMNQVGELEMLKQELQARSQIISSLTGSAQMMEKSLNQFADRQQEEPGVSASNKSRGHFDYGSEFDGGYGNQQSKRFDQQQMTEDQKRHVQDFLQINDLQVDVQHLSKMVTNLKGMALKLTQKIAKANKNPKMEPASGSVNN